MVARTAIGIDLGDTNVVVAWVNAQGDSEILANAEGQFATPAVVYFDDDRTIVGEEALLRGRNHPDRLAAHVKSALGNHWYAANIGGTHLPPEVLQACILRKVRADIDRKIPGEKVVTITVPAKFNELQRHATLEAAQLAGFASVSMLDEPIAATLAYAERTPHALLAEGGGPRRTLVLNLGGQACEASVLQLNPQGLSTIATEFDSTLGGHDWDVCLAQHVLRRLPKSQNSKLLADPGSRFRLLESAGKAKITLATREVAHWLQRAGQDSLPIEITREDFHAATKELLARVEYTIERALNAAQLTWNQIDSALLVGGASQLPAIRELLLNRTGHFPDSWISPMEAVARGAARHSVQSLYVTNSPDVPAFTIQSLCTQSVGIEGVDSKTGRHVRKLLIRHGTPLPTSVVREFITRESRQKGVFFNFLQGNSEDAQQCTLIGRAHLKDLPDDLAEDWPIDLTLNMGANGRITVDAVVRYTQRAVHLVMERPDCVSTTHLKLWQPVVEARRGLAAYVEAARQEENMNSKLPVAVASSRQTKPNTEQDAQPQTFEQSRMASLLRRLMPFYQQRPQNETAPADEVSSPESNATTDQLSPK